MVVPRPKIGRLRSQFRCCLSGRRARAIVRERLVTKQRSPVMFEQLGGVLVAGGCGGGRHLGLAELHAVERFQVEGQTARWAVERACATDSNLLEIRKLAALQRLRKG